MDKAQKDKLLKMLLPILAVVSVLVWAPNFLGGSKQKSVDKLKSKAILSTQSMDIISLVSSEVRNIKEQKSAYADWGRNPFIIEGWVPTPVDEIRREIQEVVVKERNLVLNGIFWNKTKPSALINNEVVGIGMTVGEYTVVTITAGKVVLKDSLGEFELELTE